MNVLITGGAGFIGSALTDALRLAGHTVTPLDNLSVSSRRPSRKGLVVRDVRSLTAQDLDGVDTVVHLAALKSVPASFEVGGFEHNVAVDRHILHTFVGSTARRLLLASSCEVYGEQQGPLAESAPYAPAPRTRRARSPPSSWPTSTVPAWTTTARSASSGSSTPSARTRTPTPSSPPSSTPSPRAARWRSRATAGRPGT